MADNDGSLGWYTSLKRAVFLPGGFHVSRSLVRTMRKAGFCIRFDTDFEGVMRGCMRPTGTWISEEIISAFVQAHELGFAHSSEVWLDDLLVGGTYGIAIGGYFAAESKFHTVTDASKVALWALVQECTEQGFAMVDAQIMTPHLRSLGAEPLTQEAFEATLKDCIHWKTKWSKRRI